MKITDQEMQEIIEICKKYNIENYTIKDDGTVYVNGDVDLESMGLKELPLKFDIVTGNFSCADNELTSLIGSPKEVGKSFFCFKNQLTSLVGAPEKVGGGFVCFKNKLISLVGSPKLVSYFNCNDNRLTSLVGAPEKVFLGFSCNRNNISSLKGAPLIVKGDFLCYNNPKDNPKELEYPLTIIGGGFYNI